MSPQSLTLSPELLTGHPAIDEEHRTLFERLAEIKAAIDQGIGIEKTIEIIVLLQRYTLRHFAREEEHMRRFQCPTLAKNVEQHRIFTRKVENWLSVLTVSGAPVSVLRDVHAESVAWITHHISSTDCGLRGCTHQIP